MEMKQALTLSNTDSSARTAIIRAIRPRDKFAGAAPATPRTISMFAVNYRSESLEIDYGGKNWLKSIASGSSIIVKKRRSPSAGMF
jgi:hypothetical protein